MKQRSFSSHLRPALEDRLARRGQDRDMKSLEEVLKIQADVQDEFLKHPEVTGIDVGHRTVGGKQTEELSIRIYVRNKSEALERLQLPSELQGVPVEIIERKFKVL